MSVLIIAECNAERISSQTLSCISASQSISPEIDVLVTAPNTQAAQHAATIVGVRKVISSTHAAFAHPLAEHVAPLIASIGKNYSHIIAPATSTGKDILPRAAALLDAPMLSDVITIEPNNIFTRPIYAGNALARVQVSSPIVALTIRPTAFDAAATGNAAAPIEEIPAPSLTLPVEFVSLQQNLSTRPDLAAAKIIIAGGRGVGSQENFARLEQFADKLGAAIGASRAAVDAGYAPNDLQIGQTGKVVAPELYIAIGISGAIQHLAGMKDSKVIVAINKDENAPIFEIADYALVEDWQKALSELEAAIG